MMKSFFTLNDTSFVNSVFFASFEQKSIRYCNDIMKKYSNALISKSKINKTTIFLSFADIKGSCPTSHETILSSMGTFPELRGVVPALMGTMPALIGMANSEMGMRSCSTKTIPSSLDSINSEIGRSPYSMKTIPYLIRKLPSSLESTPFKNGTLPFLKGTVIIDSGIMPHQIGIF